MADSVNWIEFTLPGFMSVCYVELWTYSWVSNQCRDMEITIGPMIHKVNQMIYLGMYIS